MRIFIHGDPKELIVGRVIDMINWRRDMARTTGEEIVTELESADLAVAPLLRRKLSAEEVLTPELGTLIFHPSLLPRHRGPDAIRWTFKLGETFSGATWFWPNDEYDAGDICEQEVLEIWPGESPRDFYERAVITSAIRLLGYALDDLKSGHVRRRPQRLQAATYEGRIPRSKESFLAKHWPVEIESPIPYMGPENGA